MSFEVRPMEDDDRHPVARVFAEVAEERDGIAAEPPVDLDTWAARWDTGGAFVAVADGDVVAALKLYPSSFGYADIGMFVAREWRGRGVGTALMQAAIAWGRERGLHKLTLSVFPHNAAAIALYEKFGFVVEGRRVKQMRRQSGELWDLIDMGLFL